MTAFTPNLPALIADLPGPGSKPGAGCRKPQTEFTRERQVRFLENLAVSGSVRSAVTAAGVSHQTAYRARRSQAPFRLAWDAALLAARVHAESVLASRAIDGVEEKVFYHGEQIDTRIRYSDRLLLAHLGRLDRLADDPRAAAVAEDFDAALARFEAGEAVLAPEPEPAEPPAEKLSPEPCNTRSMSCGFEAGGWDGEDEWEDEDEDGIDWDDPEEAAAELARIEAAMAADRPAAAPRLTGAGPDGTALDPGGLIADAQWQAFANGVPRWWLVIPPVPGPGEDWRYADDAALSEAGDGEADEPEEGEPDEEEWDEEPDDDWAEEADDDCDEDETPDEEPAGGPPAAAAAPLPGHPQVTPAPSRQPRIGALPIDDGRCTRFFGRVWDG